MTRAEIVAGLRDLRGYLEKSILAIDTLGKVLAHKSTDGHKVRERLSRFLETIDAACAELDTASIQRSGCCGRPFGSHHALGCDHERCEACGGQRIVCGCTRSDRGPYPRTKINSAFPGEMECREYGFWCVGPSGRTRCSEGVPGAVEDLNRLMLECDWAPKLGRMVRR